jgi:energy-coupling factor transporter ATP-binding protein EcfA2
MVSNLSSACKWRYITHLAIYRNRYVFTDFADEPVKGGLEAEAKESEKNLDRLIKLLPSIPKKEDWSLKFENLKIDPALAEPAFEAISHRRQAIEEALALEQLIPLNWTPVEMVLKTTEKLLATEENALNELQQAGKREILEKKLKELKAKEWLAQHKASVEVETKRLTRVKEIEAAESNTRTNSLTSKKNELAQQELAQGYKERFESELSALGGKRISVQPSAISEGKGKVSFELTLKDAKKKASTHVILSEGEMRIVALSAFLADITGSGQPTPFVFDDPISSLDQDFEERVVERLIALAKTRQVIVFTHRLSLVTLLEEAVERIAKNAETMKTDPEVTIHLETLRRLGLLVGLTSELSLREKKPQKALNKIKDHILPNLRKIYDLGDVAGYEEKAKSVCSDFRIVLERTVEKILLNDVVVRFRRSLQTMNRIGALAKIQPGDCTLIDDLMTRYSCFEHSQSEELPVELPCPDELEADVSRVLKWIVEFEKRTV